MPQIKQIFFDCDNTLALTEEAAFEACADLTNELLADHGIHDQYTSESLIVEFLGQPFRGMMAGLQMKHRFQLSTAQVKHYLQREEDAVIARIRRSARACEGSGDVLYRLAREQQYGLAVVSSSALGRVLAALECAQHNRFFDMHRHVFSATSSLTHPQPKPSPAVYLHAMRQLGRTPDECVAVEDSKSGACAAVRAGVHCIAYVGSYPTRHKQEQVAATLTKVGCCSVMYRWDQFWECLEKI